MSPHVAARAEWRGRPVSLTGLVRCLVISLLLHVPLTPLAGLLGLAMLFLPAKDDEAPPDLPPITEIPIELMPFTEAPAPAPEPAPPEPAEPTEAAAVIVPDEPPPRKKPPKPVVVDAGAPEDAGVDAPGDAGVDDAGPEDAAAPDAGAPDSADAGIADAGAPLGDAGIAAADAGSDAGTDAGTPERQPLAVRGARGVVDPNANVNVLIDSRRLRQHALGPRIGTLLASVHQWRDFFGPTGIDPVRDIDRIFITGPQLRDSSGVVAVIQHRIAQARLHAALDALVRRDPEGAWLDGGTTVAKARADRSDRYFVKVSPNLLVVTPESALKSARRLSPKNLVIESPAPEVVTAHVKTPWRVFIGTPFSIPKSLRWAEAHVSPDPAGGAIVRIVAEDADPETAAATAQYIERSIREGLDFLASASSIVSLIFGGKTTSKLVQTVEFRSEGSRVIGVLTFTEAQVVDLLERGGRMLGARAARRSAPAPSGSAPSQRP